MELYWPLDVSTIEKKRTKTKMAKNGNKKLLLGLEGKAKKNVKYFKVWHRFLFSSELLLLFPARSLLFSMFCSSCSVFSAVLWIIKTLKRILVYCPKILNLINTITEFQFILKENVFFSLIRCFCWKPRFYRN